MAHNSLTGTVIAPSYFGPGISEGTNILSGNLSTSDGSEIINVPRVTNATNNAIITNVGGDANSLTCESNLLFDGSTLNVTGDLTASVSISASIFYGDGSRLTGISAGGGGGGIFTPVAAAAAYTTSSVQIGSAVTPSKTLSVAGSSFLSGALIHKRTAVSANYSVATSDYYVGVDTSGASVALTLPSASVAADGQTFVVKDEGGAANINNIIISGSGADTIDGANHVILESPHASLQLYCNGVNKFFIC